MDYDKLDEWGKANVDCDMNAKDYLRYRVENGLLDTPRNLLLNEKWKIFINKHQVTKKLGKRFMKKNGKE